VLAVLAGLPHGGVAGLPALYAKVPVRYVLRRYRLLLPLHRLPLLLHLEIAEHGDEQQEDDEAHAAADYQAEPSRQEAADAADVAHRRAVAADYRVRRVQRLHLRATTGRRVRHLRARRGREYLDLREVQLLHRTVLRRSRRHPITETEHADQVARTRRQLRQFHRARAGLEYFGTYLDIRAIKTTSLRDFRMSFERGSDINVCFCENFFFYQCVNYILCNQFSYFIFSVKVFYLCFSLSLSLSPPKCYKKYSDAKFFFTAQRTREIECASISQSQAIAKNE